MATTLQVLYPINEGTSFNYDYYTETHLSLVDEHFGPHLTSTLVTKINGAPGGVGAYFAIATLIFADQAALDTAMGNSDPVLADIPNFTDTQPIVQVGETLG